MRTILDWLRTRALRYFVAGVFAILPVVVTAAVVIWVAGFLQRFIGPNAPLGRLLRAVGLGFSSDTTMAYIIGWALVLLVIMVVGMFVEAGARGFFQRLFDALLSRVPWSAEFMELANRSSVCCTRRKAISSRECGPCFARSARSMVVAFWLYWFLRKLFALRNATI